MADRKKLQEELNRINELYQETDLNMNKAGGSTQQRQQLRDMLNAKKKTLMDELGDDLTTLNSGKGITVKNVTKTPKLLGMLGKKAAGIIPFAGAGMAALSGEPAMAAEELAGDLVPGLEAVKSDDAGMSSGDERMMLAEDQARKNYEKSPARQDKLNNEGNGMGDKFTKTLGSIRKPIGREKYEALSGKSLQSADKASIFRDRLEAAETEDEKKKIRQAAHFQGVKLD